MTCKRSKAFTLVELLVVIGIIAVLIAILLPALKRAQEQVKRVNCLNNHKQLMTAITMYTNDWRGVLPFAGWRGKENQGANSWWPGPGWLYWDSQRRNQGDYTFVADDVKTGSLWKYLRNQKVYFCPFQEERIWEGTTQVLSDYCMNGAVIGFGATTSPVGPTPPSWKLSKIVQFQRDAICFWEIDEGERDNFNDSSNYPREYENLTRRHGKNGSIVSYFAGHADFVTRDQYRVWLLEGGKPTPLWCNPGHPQGRQ